MPRPSEKLPPKVSEAIPLIEEGVLERIKDHLRSVFAWSTDGQRNDFEVIGSSRLIRASMRTLRKLLASGKIEFYGISSDTSFSFPLIEALHQRLRKEFKGTLFFSHDIKEFIGVILARLLSKNYEVRLVETPSIGGVPKREQHETRPNTALLH